MVSAGRLSLHVHWVSQTTPWQGKLKLCVWNFLSELWTTSSLMVPNDGTGFSPQAGRGSDSMLVLSHKSRLFFVSIRRIPGFVKLPIMPCSWNALLLCWSDVSLPAAACWLFLNWFHGVCQVVLLGMDILSALVSRLQDRFRTQVGTGESTFHLVWFEFKTSGKGTWAVQR